jgi:hypothetical protein
MTQNSVIALPLVSQQLIPEGTYPVTFMRSAVSKRFGRGSLELWFKIVEFGAYFEQPICRFYKVELTGKRSFRASPRSAFARDFASVFGRLPPAGLAAVGHYRDVLVSARVRVVTTDYRQEPLTEAAYYSVIGALIGRVKS